MRLALLSHWGIVARCFFDQTLDKSFFPKSSTPSVAFTNGKFQRSLDSANETSCFGKLEMICLMEHVSAPLVANLDRKFSAYK